MRRPDPSAPARLTPAEVETIRRVMVAVGARSPLADGITLFGLIRGVRREGGVITLATTGDSPDGGYIEDRVTYHPPGEGDEAEAA